jgi:tellurite resistance protein TerC
VLFTTFRVPNDYQHRVLFWGILGALILRAIFIGAGTTLVQNFHWIFYVFGALLIYTGVKLFVQRDEDPEPQNNPMVRLFQRFVPVTAGYRGPHFFAFENGRRYATPLLLVLVAIEASDLVFALDSIPAIFAVTDDPFIVFTSNIFAILGLRSLYFLLAGVMNRFHYLKYGLALILIYVGVKMLLAELHIYKIPIELSLGIIAGLLLGAIVFSLFKPNREPEAERASEPPPPAPARGASD